MQGRFLRLGFFGFIGVCLGARVLSQPRLTHLADGAFLAAPVPALAELPGRDTCCRQHDLDHVVGHLTTIEQCRSDRYLGGVNASIAGALIAHRCQAAFHVDRRLVAEAAGHGEPGIIGLDSAAVAAVYRLATQDR
jgi:hypothetical protein